MALVLRRVQSEGVGCRQVVGFVLGGLGQDVSREPFHTLQMLVSEEHEDGGEWPVPGASPRRLPRATGPAFKHESRPPPCQFRRHRFLPTCSSYLPPVKGSQICTPIRRNAPPLPGPVQRQPPLSPKVIKINAVDNLPGILKRTLGPYLRYNFTCRGLSERSSNR